EHRTEVTEDTDRNLSTQLSLDAVSEPENVEVTQSELIEYRTSPSQQYGMNPNEFARMLDTSGQVTALVAEGSARKPLAAVLAGATVKDTAGNLVDMEAFTSPPEDEDAEAEGADAETSDEAAAEAAEEN